MNFMPFYNSNGSPDLWIGLYNEEEFNSENSCGCGSAADSEECTQCRNKFKWVDTRVGSGYTQWAGTEPDGNEKCVRLRNDGLVGTVCGREFGFICYQGPENKINIKSQILM